MTGASDSQAHFTHTTSLTMNPASALEILTHKSELSTVQGGQAHPNSSPAAIPCVFKQSCSVLSKAADEKLPLLPWAMQDRAAHRALHHEAVHLCLCNTGRQTCVLDASTTLSHVDVCVGLDHTSLLQPQREFTQLD